MTLEATVSQADWFLVWAALQQIIRNEVIEKMFLILFPILFL